ncbi:MAG: ComF family protein [Gammaproteobacteria bacterium]|nr:ComF family protein [Gammaproteobacteria bacterium]
MDDLIFAILPGTCIICEASTHRKLDLCVKCELELPWLNNACLHCSIPLPDGNNVCGQCLFNKPPFTRCYSGFVYKYPIDRLILDFKENQKLLIGKLLATLLLKSFPENFTPPDLLVPIPLHKSALKKRGFNQSLEIAEVLSGNWSVPMDTRNCRRIVETTQQKSLHQKDRANNIRGAFAIEKSYQGERIAIIDDVVTTGATVTEFARLILANGAASTEVICIARTPVQRTGQRSLTDQFLSRFEHQGG